jgi:hypothetical protein
MAQEWVIREEKKRMLSHYQVVLFNSFAMAVDNLGSRKTWIYNYSLRACTVQTLSVSGDNR